MVLIAAFGLFMLIHGIDAQRQGREWAAAGSHKSGPMTPAAEMVTGAIILVGLCWAIISSKKNEK